MSGILEKNLECFFRRFQEKTFPGTDKKKIVLSWKFWSSKVFKYMCYTTEHLKQVKKT